MKKYLKILSLISLLIIISTLFSSCNGLDEMRKTQAFWNNTEKTEIIYNNEIYKKIDLGTVELLSDYRDTVQINITEKDVPVLLSEFFGTYAAVRQKGKFIVVSSEEYYCLAEDYDEILLSLKDMEPTSACVYNYDIYKGGYGLLSDEDNEILNSIISLDEAKVISYENIKHFGAVYRCDEKMIFSYEWFNFKKADGKYYLSGSGNEYYEVPKEHEEWFEEICEKYFE